MRKGFDYIGVGVIFFCHDGQGRMVLHKRSVNCRDEQGKWDSGGGAMEFGLSVEENLRKEIWEEYGAEVLEYKFLGMRDVHRVHGGEKTHWIALDYLVRVDPAQVKIGEPEKCEELRWFRVSEIPKEEDLHSQFPVCLKKYAEEFGKL